MLRIERSGLEFNELHKRIHCILFCNREKAWSSSTCIIIGGLLGLIPFFVWAAWLVVRFRLAVGLVALILVDSAGTAGEKWLLNDCMVRGNWRVYIS